MKLKYRYPLAPLREVPRDQGAERFAAVVDHNIAALVALDDAAKELAEALKA